MVVLYAWLCAAETYFIESPKPFCQLHQLPRVQTPSLVTISLIHNQQEDPDGMRKDSIQGFYYLSSALSKIVNLKPLPPATGNLHLHKKTSLVSRSVQLRKDFFRTRSTRFLNKIERLALLQSGERKLAIAFYEADLMMIKRQGRIGR